MLQNYAGKMYLKDLKKKGVKNESANMKNRTQKSVFEKMPPTQGAFHQHVKRAHLQSLIFNEGDKAVIEIKNPEYFECKFDVTHYIAIVTNDPVAPDTVISFTLCNCKDHIFLLVFVGWLCDHLDNHIFRQVHRLFLCFNSFACPVFKNIE